MVAMVLFLLPPAARRPARGFLIPTDRSLVEIDEHLFRLEILFKSPGSQLAAKAGLLVTAPRRFHVSRLHMIDPDDAGAQRLHDAEGLIDVAGPDCCGESIGRIVGDADGVRFAIKGNHRSYRPE